MGGEGGRFFTKVLVSSLVKKEPLGEPQAAGPRRYSALHSCSPVTQKIFTKVLVSSLVKKEPLGEPQAAGTRLRENNFQSTA